MTFMLGDRHLFFASNEEFLDRVDEARRRWFLLFFWVRRQVLEFHFYGVALLDNLRG